MQVEIKMKIPLSVKAPLVFIGLFAFFTVLYIAKSIIIPLVFATIIAIVLHPVIGALLNLIPYLGSVIAASLPMMIAIVTKTSPWFALLVLALCIFIQFIDNNYIVPKIVASKVKINALASIVAVVVFGAMWGVQGMLVAIPLRPLPNLYSTMSSP